MISKNINYRFYRIVVLALAIIVFIPVISIAADVTLAWDANTEYVAGYKVYYGYSSRNDENSKYYGKYQYFENYGYSELNINDNNMIAYKISGLQSGQIYYFAVTAYNIEGYESDFSEEIFYYVPWATTDKDSDGDGLTDNEEITVYKTNPNDADTDRDNITDGNEVNYWGYNWNEDYDEDSIINLLDSDSDNDGFLDGLELAYEFNPSDPDSRPLFPCMETGEASITHEWHRIKFSRYFVDPVVVANSLSYNGNDPAVLRIRNVDNTGFDIRIQEWPYLYLLDGGYHVSEKVGYVIMERSNYTLEDGTMVEAGSFTTNNTTSLKTVYFKNRFKETPVVIAAVVSYNEEDAVLCRTVASGTTGFEFCLQEQEKNEKIHATEEVAYIAWEKSLGVVDDIAFEINCKSGVKELFKKVLFSFDQTFKNSPVFISDLQTANGFDPANVRWEDKSTLGIYVSISEEQSDDIEIFHRPESIGYMVFSVSE